MTNPDSLSAPYRFLASAAEVLSSSLDYGQTLQHLADLAIPAMGDLCIVDVVENGVPRRVAVAHRVPAKLQLVDELRRRHPVTLDSPQPAGRVLRTGRADLLSVVDPQVVAANTRDAAHARLIDAIGIRSHLAVPLVARGATIGVISLGITESDRRYGDDDLAFALDLARIAAIAIDNARLYERAQHEIEERSRTHEALLLSEQRFRGVMEQSPMSMQVLAPDGSTISVNRAWQQLWGATIEVIREYNILADPQLDAAGVTPLLRRAFAGEVVELPTIRYDPNDTLPNSSANRDSARWVSAFAYPVKNAAGDVQEVVLVHRDVTAARHAEARIATSEERLRLALEASRMNVWDWDLATDVVACSMNARDFWGIDIGVAADFMRVVHPDDIANVAAAAQAAIANPAAPYFCQYRLLGPEGQVRWVESRGRVDCDQTGRAVRLLGVTLDVSDLKAADERKDEFLATLAHELRNPLAPIRTGAALLRAATDPALIERTRQIIERQVRHLARLVDDLLDVSRISRGTLLLVKAPVDLGTVIATAVETSRPLLEAAKLTLTTDLPLEPIVLEGDHLRLSQAISNILNNAAKFTPSGGTVHVAAGLASHQVTIRITDSGIGIPVALLQRVFDMFVQGPAGQRSASGLGIGLTIVKRLVELHDGSVRAESAGEGAGSTFVITLPATNGRSAPDISRPMTTATPASPRASRRVLLVDDNVDAADTLAALLVHDGDDVRTAQSGEGALALLDDFAPELALLDIGLPDISGYDLARRIRRRLGRQVTLIAITGWGQEADRARARDAGFDHHLTKPIDYEELMRMITPLQHRTAGATEWDR